MILLISNEVLYLAYYDNKGRVRVELYSGQFAGHKLWIESTWSLCFRTIGDYVKEKKKYFPSTEILHIDEEIQDEFC